MTEKEITALKAVLYLATHNSLLECGGTYVENVHDYENCAKIQFTDEVDIVAAMLYPCEENQEINQNESK